MDNLDDPIDYEEVSQYAKAGVKNPRVIANVMGFPVEWALDTYSEEVEAAIDRGLAMLSMEMTQLVRTSAERGDFAAQKYLLQNIDEEWTDKTTIDKNVNVKAMPSLQDLLMPPQQKEKPKDNIIDITPISTDENTKE